MTSDITWGQVDWSAPIEAVFPATGDVSAAEMIGPHPNGWLVAIADWTCSVVASPSGVIVNSGWRIRNLAQPAAEAPTAPSGGEVGPEVVERMIALVRGLAAVDGLGASKAMETEARAIVALLPEPVDGDLVEARERAIALLSKTAVSKDIPDQHPEIIRIREGRGDHNSFVVDILAAIKRGRALAAGDR